ncbi:UbiD family decarboxylase [Lentzea sp. CA-135723]|uniref:UbiD family decarboxylase n=1 Tax=Lentzea sp. CA-135723 TaxID=3239950 RepID=UPI003D916B32
MKHFTDLRSYLNALEDLGDLVTISREVDGDMEPAAITRRSYEVRARAPLFVNIKGARQGQRILGAPAAMSSRKDLPYARIALSLGLPADSTGYQIVDALADAAVREPIAPVVVSKGPCQDNVLMGPAATLDSFPIPIVHEKDGGRYANTWGVLIVRTPDGSWTNWSIARVMKIDGKRMTALVPNGQHIGQIWNQWAAIGKPMPYALVQGAEPGIPYVAGMPLPDSAHEAHFLGALVGEPIELVQALTVDLEVPATAEVVIEGHVSTERDALEGPFGEAAGYQPVGSSPQPTFHVYTITHRDDPIWPLVAEGRPPDEYHTVTCVGAASQCLVRLRAAGLPVSRAWAPMEAAGMWLVVTVPPNWRDLVEPGTTSEQLATWVGQTLFYDKAGLYFPQIYLLDDDIDATNIAELTWAIATRVHPVDGRVHLDSAVLPLFVSHTEEEHERGWGPRTVLDGLLPPIGERLGHTSFAASYPRELQQRVVENWI